MEALNEKWSVEYVDFDSFIAVLRTRNKTFTNLDQFFHINRFSYFEKNIYYGAYKRNLGIKLYLSVIILRFVVKFIIKNEIYQLSNFKKLTLKLNMKLIFEGYTLFSFGELGDASEMVAYELQPTFCKFSIIFKKDYFVFLERFYEYLKNSFQFMQIVGWNDFRQEYSYETENHVTFDLICKKKEPLAKYFCDKRDCYYADLFSNYRHTTNERKIWYVIGLLFFDF